MKWPPKQLLWLPSAFFGVILRLVAAGLGRVFLVSFLFPHVNQAESAKEFELHNLARNIPQISRECGLNGLPWQTRVGRIRD